MADNDTEKNYEEGTDILTANTDENNGVEANADAAENIEPYTVKTVYEDIKPYVHNRVAEEKKEETDEHEDISAQSDGESEDEEQQDFISNRGREYTKRRADAYFGEHTNASSFGDGKLKSEKEKKRNKKMDVRSEAAKSIEEQFEMSGGLNKKMYFMTLVVLTVFDLFAMNLFVRNVSYFLSDKILIALGFGELKFANITMDEMCLGLGYFVSLIAGGLLLYILMKLLSMLFVYLNVIKKSKHIPFIAVSAFALIFIIGFIVMYIMKDSFVAESVYKWGCPAMAYIGGCISYVSSKFHIGIDY